MSETNLASQLRKKYVYQQQPRDECQTDSPKAATDDQQVTEKVVLEVDKQDQVARELESLEKKYLRLVIDARSTMEAANLSVIELESFSQFYLNEEVTTVKELFQLLKPFCFLDYSLLETVITFLIDPAHKVVDDLSEYVKQLTNFKKSTMLGDFMQSIKNAQKTKERTGTSTVILRLGEWLLKEMKLFTYSIDQHTQTEPAGEPSSLQLTSEDGKHNTPHGHCSLSLPLSLPLFLDARNFAIFTHQN